MHAGTPSSTTRKAIFYTVYLTTNLFIFIGCKPITSPPPENGEAAQAWEEKANLALAADDLETAKREAEEGLRNQSDKEQTQRQKRLISEINARQTFLNQRVSELTEEAFKHLGDGELKRAKEKVAQALSIEKATNLSVARDALNTIKGYELANTDEQQKKQQVNTWPEIIERAQKAILVIGAKFDNGIQQGTGFAISDDLIITNNHVITDKTDNRLATEVMVINGERKTISVSGLLYQDENKDIAIIRAKNNWPKNELIGLLDGHPVYNKTIRQGEEVVALGHPMGFKFSSAFGHISAIRPAKTMPLELKKANTNGVWVQHSASISQGNSGGPLINKAGEVVAMNTLIFYPGQSQNLNFAISGADIRDAVNLARKSDLTQFEGKSQQLGALRAAIEQLQFNH